jgi:hypothetical protein
VVATVVVEGATVVVDWVVTTELVVWTGVVAVVVVLVLVLPQPARMDASKMVTSKETINFFKSLPPLMFFKMKKCDGFLKWGRGIGLACYITLLKRCQTQVVIFGNKDKR